MFKRAILKYFIFLIILSLSFMVILGSPFIYAAEVTEGGPDLKSSPVGETDLTKYFNMNMYGNPDFTVLMNKNRSLYVNGNLAARTWSYNLPANVSADNTFYSLGLFNDGLTLVDGYRYVIKCEILIRSEYSDSTTSFNSFRPSFVLYSEFTDSGAFISVPVDPTSVEELSNDRRVYTWDFVFDANSLIVNPFKGDKPVLNSDGTYTFSGYGFMIGRGDSTKILSSLGIIWFNREAYVFSPDDYMAYYTLSELWNMGGDKSSWVDESIDEATHESGHILDNLGQMVLPDIDDASGYANPFSQMDPYWFEEFSRILGPIVDNPFITTLIVLAAIFCMLSYVLFGKKV